MTLKDLIEGATIEGVRVTLAGGICPHCDTYSKPEDIKAHDGTCEKHPMHAEVLRLRAHIKELESTIEGLTV